MITTTIKYSGTKSENNRNMQSHDKLIVINNDIHPEPENATIMF